MKRILSLVILSLISFSALAVGDLTGVLTQEMLNAEGEMFYVRVNYTLAGATLTVPAGKVLVFSGGSLDNGEIIGTGTSIQMNQQKPAFGLSLVISGTWNVPEVHDGWFMFDRSEGFVSNQIIKNILAFSNDETPCHILLEENRTYYFELPYKGRADLGAVVSYQVVDGKKKRNYSELSTDDYSFLRIFTIPSNTRLTVNNTLKMLSTNQGAYFIFWEHGKENITIDGHGTIAGDNDWHRYDSPFLGKTYYGEWGFIFRCIKCKNFTFRDITLSDAFGDCMYYSGSSFPMESGHRWSSGLTMENVKVLRARRNGIAVGARQVRIVNCFFEGCGTKAVNGTPPQCAINFEPNSVRVYREVGNQDVLVENCTFVGNEIDLGSSLNNLPRYGKIATVVRNCSFSTSVKITATYWMRFENCHIPYLRRRSDREDFYSGNMEFVNCTFEEDSATVKTLFYKPTNIFIDCQFNIKGKDSSQ